MEGFWVKKIIYGTIFSAALVVSLYIASISQNTHASLAVSAEIASVNASGNGQGGNGNSPISAITSSIYSQMSRDGRFIVFTSHASDLVSNDTNNLPDVFVRDLELGTTVLASISSSGVQANKRINNFGAVQAAISSTGRYVVFASEATNLIDGTTTTGTQIFMRDMKTNTTSIISQNSSGINNNGTIVSVEGVSNDGRFIAWIGYNSPSLDPDYTDSVGQHLYIADMNTRTFQQLDPGVARTDGRRQMRVGGASMSCDGALVAFSSGTQISPQDSNNVTDIYLYDTRNGSTIKNISYTDSADGRSDTPSLSCNGEFLSFTSNNTQILPSAGTTTNRNHIYLYDLINEEVSLASSSNTGVPGNGYHTSNAVDDNGNVVFGSSSTNFGTATTNGLYIKRKATGQVEFILQKPSGQPSTVTHTSAIISASGNKVSTTALQPSDLLTTSDTNGMYDVIVITLSQE